MVAEAARVKDLGFSGKGAIHPKQIGAINEVFTPTEAEIDVPGGLSGRLRRPTPGWSSSMAS